MDKELLIQYCDILEERKDILKRINTLQSKNHQIITNVKGSSKEFPYIERHYVINGIDINKESSIKKLEKMLIEFDQKLLEQQTEVERFIESIKDSQTREIFRLRYIEGMSWYQIALSKGLTGESVPRMRHDRYLEKK